MAFTSSSVTFLNKLIFFNKYSLHSLKIEVSFASFKPSIKSSIFLVLMPSKSYPTLMLNMKPSGEPSLNSFAITLIANHAFTYSSKASGTLSSVDHSQL